MRFTAAVSRKLFLMDEFSPTITSPTRTAHTMGIEGFGGGLGPLKTYRRISARAIAVMLDCHM